jgi:hypothetical protein
MFGAKSGFACHVAESGGQRRRGRLDGKRSDGIAHIVDAGGAKRSLISALFDPVFGVEGPTRAKSEEGHDPKAGGVAGRREPPQELSPQRR